MAHMYRRSFGRKCVLCPRYFWPAQANQKYCSASCSRAASVLYASLYNFIRYRKKHHKEIGGEPIDISKVVAEVEQRRRREVWDASPWA